MTGLTGWGTRFLKYALWAAAAAFAVLPLRFGYLLSGLVLGGLAMIGLTVVRDAIELATMDTELPDMSEVLTLLWGGKLICWGCGLVVLTDLVGLAFGEWKWRLRRRRVPAEPPADPPVAADADDSEDAGARSGNGRASS